MFTLSASTGCSSSDSSAGTCLSSLGRLVHTYPSTVCTTDWEFEWLSPVSTRTSSTKSRA